MDDILFIGSDLGLLYEAKIFLIKNFKMNDINEITFVINIKILSDNLKDYYNYFKKDILIEF